eukprot:Rhum_TRINITY_DN12628_c0_g1::Rhum_TRINITY_DN12628_c0_g1_i1::g.53316::m.53316
MRGKDQSRRVDRESAEALDGAHNLKDAVIPRRLCPTRLKLALHLCLKRIRVVRQGEHVLLVERTLAGEAVGLRLHNDLLHAQVLAFGAERLERDFDGFDHRLRHCWVDPLLTLLLRDRTLLLPLLDGLTVLHDLERQHRSFEGGTSFGGSVQELLAARDLRHVTRRVVRHLDHQASLRHRLHVRRRHLHDRLRILLRRQRDPEGQAPALPVRQHPAVLLPARPRHHRRRRRLVLRLRRRRNRRRHRRRRHHHRRRVPDGRPAARRRLHRRRRHDTTAAAAASLRHGRRGDGGRGGGSGRGGGGGGRRGDGRGGGGEVEGAKHLVVVVDVAWAAQLEVETLQVLQGEPAGGCVQALHDRVVLLPVQPPGRVRRQPQQLPVVQKPVSVRVPVREDPVQLLKLLSAQRRRRRSRRSRSRRGVAAATTLPPRPPPKRGRRRRR